MHRNQYTDREFKTATIITILPSISLITIILIALLRSCIVETVDPIDNSINKSREVICNLIVTDSTNNGFRATFASVDEVTKLRLKEIQTRPRLDSVFKLLQKEAPIYFGNMIETDIYDFAAFALKYKYDPDIEIHNIFAYGKQKCELYIGENKKIENSAIFFHHGTEQGNQYISRDDIYYRTKTKTKIYRYWKCYGINAISYKDERFSHFSEDDRIW